MPRTRLVVLLLLLSSTSTLFVPRGLFGASTSSTLQVSNTQYGSNIASPTDLNPGTSFTVNVTIANPIPVQFFNITLSYSIAGQTPPISTDNSSISFSSGLFDGHCGTFFKKSVASPAPAYTVRAFAQLSDYYCNHGSGKLFSVTFNVIGKGSTSIAIEQVINGVQQDLVRGASKAITGLSIVNAYFSNEVHQNPSGSSSPSSSTSSTSSPTGTPTSPQSAASRLPGNISYEALAGAVVVAVVLMVVALALLRRRRPA